METQLSDSRAYGTPDTCGICGIRCQETLGTWRHRREGLLQPARVRTQEESPLDSCDSASNFCPQSTSKISLMVPLKGIIELRLQVAS